MRENQQFSSRPTNQTSPNRRKQPQSRLGRETNPVQTHQNSTSPAMDLSIDSRAQTFNQYVLQIASAMIFNEAEQEYEPVTMLLDSGAQRSFIKSHVSNTLKLPIISSTSFTTTGMGELRETFTSKEVPITLKGLHGTKKLQRVSVYTKERLTAKTSTAQLSEADKRFIKDRRVTLAQADLKCSDVSPDLLIGQDLLSTIIDHSAPILHLPSGLILTPTVFGYTISGTSEAHLTNDASSTCSSLIVATPFVTSPRDDYKKDIKHLYELESLGLNISNDSHEASMIKFMNNYRKSIVIQNGRITAGFPFTEDVANLSDNFNVAIRRFQSLFKVLQGDTEKMFLYNDTLMDYLKEGIIEDCNNAGTGIATFYLPHRHVWTPSKSTKLRVVFDASSHAKDQLSLNDVVYEGYSLSPLIHEILLRFRTHQYTMTADIQKAFLQIQLPEDHRDVTRFLWVKDLSKPPQGSNLRYFRFCRVPFGVNAGPAILNQSLLKHIEETSSVLGQELSNSLYVDNVLLEGETPDELLAKYEESKKIFSSIGMNLRDYLSNSVEVNERIKEHDRATNTSTKILGIGWNSTDDTISFECTDKGSSKISKRTVLSQINGYCYDPLGLLTPLMTPAKVFLQDLHKQKYGWDTELLQTDQETWRSIKANISGFEKELPRKISVDTTASHTISVFVDSSKRVYACSIYVTSISESGQKESRLFTAKSKVAPINKEQTIPRLELLSIFIGLSLTESTVEKVNLRIEQINVFSDSTIALYWIHGTKRLPPTVSTLVQKIELIRKRLSEQTPVSFYHVPTHENIADCATRGIPKEEFANHTWWCGPTWLNRPTEDWPVKKATDLRSQEPSDEEDADLCTSVAAKGEPVWPTDKISNFSKLSRVVAYCARFIRNASKQKYLKIQRIGLLTTTPSADEIIQAEALIIRQEQSIHGSEVLIQNKQLNVNYDENRILRKFGRLQNADISYDAANPIHIPKQSKLGQLIAEQQHRSLSHCGLNQLLYNIRQRYWIPQDRVLCKRVLRNCAICRRFNATPFKYPNMGPLPKERVTESPPFTYTGVDLMGPILIKGLQSEEAKRYVVLFTCLVTRLVHLEIATDLSAKSFIFTLKRFIARRGVPQKIISDNGTNFQLAETLLSKADVNEDDAHLSLFLAEHKISWNFIPPSSPWMGGVWERMVGTVKRSLQKTIGRRKLTEELLHTTLCEIESVVNSRPLTTLGDQSSPCEILRPIDFVYKDIRHGTTQLSPRTDEDDPDYLPYPELSSQKAAKEALTETERLTKKFWTMWKHEYLVELRDRHQLFGKNHKATNREPRIGDVVIMDEDNHTSRGQWPLAVIIDIVRSRDGSIRSVILRTNTGREVQRPVNRIIPLEIQSACDTTNNEDFAPPSGVIAKIKKVLKKKTADDESELRKQPARVAKKPINYKEMNQNSAHVTKRNVTSSSSNAVTMILLSIALLGINTAAAQTIVCSNKGVLLNSTSPTKSEICVNYKECVTISADVNVSEITLPFKYLVNQHIVQWRTIINSKQETETIICPPGEICSKISCIFCAEFFGNPHCFPQLAVGIMAACLSLLMAPILMICYFVTSSTKRRYRLKQGKDNMTPRGSQGRQLERIFASHPLRSKMIVFTAIMTCLAAEAEACVFSHNINANNTICHKTNSSDNCRQVQETTITLSERRPEACLRLRNANQTVGSMEVRLQHVVLSCNPVVLFYTRDVDIITESAKRCHLAGSCTSQTCSHTRRTTQIPELQDTYDFPGVSRCTTSCGGIGCGCLLPMPGCLFSRTFARPRNTKVYRVFHCPTWEESAMIKITHSDAKGKRRTTVVNVISQTTKVLDNINVTLEFVTTPTIPLLSSIFLQAVNNDSNSEVALIENDDVFALRCPTEKSTSNVTECIMEDTCSCSPTETDANCQCRNLNITERVSSVESRLPLSSSVLYLQDVNGRVQGISHDSVADLTIGTSVQYQTDNMVDYMDCDISASPLHGCYNCLSGAEVIFSCFSKQPIMVEVNCERHMFAAVCNSSTSHTAVTIHATVPKFKEACWVQCGPSLHNITLSGILAYHASWIPSNNNKQGNKHANYVDMFNYPNLEHLLDVAVENWKTAVMTIVAVAVFIGVGTLMIPKLVSKLMC
ncbi:hypothetical protein Y032_0009g755 [Ancylostoma ceylanicum]|uniref:Integrase catalytic domain-containing protein n=1 Tax=Ancylostoma ceylanicum TaxID=53326 RepID=A0A016VKD5_9BILA|nr:hypothetical protein Y032_0009g755 [Ancylostoma ceylanicum]